MCDLAQSAHLGDIFIYQGFYNIHAQCLFLFFLMETVSFGEASSIFHNQSGYNSLLELYYYCLITITITIAITITITITTRNYHPKEVLPRSHGRVRLTTFILLQLRQVA